jgi:fatty acyl-CoA reductase
LQDRLFRFLFHSTPALVIDGVLTVLRRPTFMRKLINTMTIGIEAINFFCLHEWSWTNTNLNNLQSALVNTDTESLESFSFDIRSLDWKIFTDHNVLGMRHYVLKDNPDSIESSRKKLNILYFLHRIIQLAFVFFVIYNLMNFFSTWDVSKDIGLPVPDYSTLSNNFSTLSDNIMARIWNAVPGLQHASTLGAAK